MQKKNIDNGALRSPVPTINVVHNHVKSTDAKSEYNKYELY